MPVLSIDDVRTYIQDRAPNNHLLDGVEFPDEMIMLAMDLAINEYNAITPTSGETLATFQSKSLLMSGTLYKLFQGQAALLFRNHLSYVDGNLSIPVEERGQFYQSLASMYQQDFISSATKFKIQDNIENGWGQVRSDYAAFPLW